MHDREKDWKYDEISKVRREALYESPRIKRYMYTMNRRAPSSRQVAGAKTASLPDSAAEKGPTPKPCAAATIAEDSPAFRRIGVEVFCDTGENRACDPACDAIRALFMLTVASGRKNELLVIEREAEDDKEVDTGEDMCVDVGKIAVRTERELIEKFAARLGRSSVVFFGYDTRLLSVGYVAVRYYRIF